MKQMKGGGDNGDDGSSKVEVKKQKEGLEEAKKRRCRR